jgi:hypothetical protein
MGFTHWEYQMSGIKQCFVPAFYSTKCVEKLMVKINVGLTGGEKVSGQDTILPQVCQPVKRGDTLL